MAIRNHTALPPRRRGIAIVAVLPVISALVILIPSAAFTFDEPGRAGDPGRLVLFSEVDEAILPN